MGFKDYVISILVISLFIVCIFSFTVGLVNSYGYSSSLISNNKINFSLIEKNLNETNAKGEVWKNLFTSDKLTDSVAGLVVFSIWGIFQQMWSSISTFFNIILFSISNILGIPAIVIGTILTIVIILILFAGWKLIKNGE